MLQSMDRRRFLHCIAAAATMPAIGAGCVQPVREFGELKADKQKLLELPFGFRYRIVSEAGDKMDDGLRVPGAHDGMAAFAREDGLIALICNHETLAGWPEESPFGKKYHKVPESIKERLYDRGRDLTPAFGGTTTTIWDEYSSKTKYQFLSLGGTEINCAGGPTPWGSWLSCEETFTSPGQATEYKTPITREQKHGYVFEVPSQARKIVEPVPLRAMGRFVHEAAVVDPQTGYVYQTEDMDDGLFYRFIPNAPGKLAEGGKLQALVITGKDAVLTRNWEGPAETVINTPLACHWVDIDEADVEEDDLRYKGAAKGAAVFARGEGACWAADRVAFTCTEGGPSRIGQIFTYRPTSIDGGQLELIAEVQPDSIMRFCDNITMAPWGDLLCCEDRGLGSGIVGIRPDGSFYRIARNSYTKSELAGICFSPDGSTMFVNIQYPGMTLAIKGPWPTAA